MQNKHRYLVSVVILISMILTGCGNSSYDKLLDEYSAQIEQLRQQNDQMADVIADLQQTIDKMNEQSATITPELTQTLMATSTPTPTSTSTPTPTSTSTPTPTPKPTATPTVRPTMPPEIGNTGICDVIYNRYDNAVDTSSAYSSSFSAQFDMSGEGEFPGTTFTERQPVYFYHPVRIVFDDNSLEPCIWTSSDNKVARVYSDGVVEAFAEGVADISAYDKNGQLIGCVPIFTTTKADADPIGSCIEYTKFKSISDAYKDIAFQDIQDSINNITDLVSYMCAYTMSYNMNEEGSTPSVIDTDRLWIQTIGSDWLFKNGNGICHNASAAAIYSLVGDYEKNGIIQMSGIYGHTISWFFENGLYYVFDFTSVYDQAWDIGSKYQNNVYAFVLDYLGTGETLYDAFLDLTEKQKTFYLENTIIYAVELTGKDYYPAESNSWMQDGDFSGNNILSFAEGTKVEILYVAEGVSLDIQYVPREDIPECMRAYVLPTDTEDIAMDTNYGRLRVLEAKANKDITSEEGCNLGLGEDVKITNSFSANELLTSVLTKSDDSGSFTKTMLEKNAGAEEQLTAIDFSDTYLFLLPEGKEAAFYISGDSNILRVRSDGKLKAYSEGITEVYAIDKDGNVVASHLYIVTNAADADPLAMTLVPSGKLTGVRMHGSIYDNYGRQNAYQDIEFEDIPEKIKTITDYVAWLYANHAEADASREPQSPRGILQNESEFARWFPMANSEWVFLDSSGVCCNFAAGADYSLCNDYEKSGRFMMNGPYGHVINYYFENGNYYVIDYTKVVEDHTMIYSKYASNPYNYVKERIGVGNSLREAYKDYMSKNDRWYYDENLFIYSVETTGYNFYHSECNNWASQGIDKERANTLYSSTPEKNEIFIIKDGYEFKVVKLEKNEIPGAIQTFYSLDEPNDWSYAKYFNYFDNSKYDVATLTKNYGSGSGNNDDAGNTYSDHSGENINKEPSKDILTFGLLEGEKAEFWGIRDNVDYPSSIVIPEEYIMPGSGNLYTVTSIGAYALTGKRITDLYVPATVESVGEYALNVDNIGKLTIHVYAGSFMEKYCKQNGYRYKIITEE